MARGRRLLAYAGLVGVGVAGTMVWLRRRERAADPNRPLIGSPLVIAHRGGAGLWPENTLFAFRNVVRAFDVDAIELDVRASADGRCVVIHDPSVDRTTNGTGLVERLSLEELRSLDAGYRFTRDNGRTYPFRDQGVRIPTIEEVLEALPTTNFVIEVKTAAAQEPLFAAIRRRGAEGRVLAAGERLAFRTLFSGYGGPISGCVEHLLPFYALHRAGLGAFWAPPIDAVQIPETWRGRQLLTPGLVADFHAHGIPVHIWTVNDAADMHRLLDWGVDGLVTDRPDVMLEVLAERGELHADRVAAEAPSLE